jgi:hypothetical protein
MGQKQEPSGGWTDVLRTIRKAGVDFANMHLLSAPVRLGPGAPWLRATAFSAGCRP